MLPLHVTWGESDPALMASSRPDVQRIEFHTSDQDRSRVTDVTQGLKGGFTYERDIVCSKQHSTRKYPKCRIAK